MKKSRVLPALFLILTMVISSCGQPTPVPTVAPTRTLPAPTPTTGPFTERLGHIRFPGPHKQATYVYRSFLQGPAGLAWGPDDHMYIADSNGHHVVRIAKDGTMDDLPFWKTVPILQFNGPLGVNFDSQGNLYVNNLSQVFRLDTSGVLTELEGFQESQLGSLVFNAQDKLYYTDRGTEGGLRKWLPPSWSQSVGEALPFAENMVFDRDGNLYLTQNVGAGNVLKIDMNSGTVSTFKQDICDYDPCYLAIDADGDIWLHGLNRLNQFTPEGVEKPFIVDGKQYKGEDAIWATSSGIAFDDEGGLWVASYNSKLVRLVPLTPGTPDPQFTLQVISPGMQASGLAFGSGGELYVPDVNSKLFYRFMPDGQMDVLLDDIGEGRVPVAVDAAGAVYLGLGRGEIVRYEPDGTLVHYADVTTRRMAFGTDGALYAVAGEFNQPKSIVRISGVDAVTTLASQIGGISLGNGEIHISPALDQGFYLITEVERNLFFMDYSGQGRLITNLAPLGGGWGPIDMAASLVTGSIFYLAHGPYVLYRITPDGASTPIADRLFGDPWAMVVSPDGQWLYVAENGAIDKIPLAENER
jgi:sugar lactone lactonase YvrE